MSAAHGDPARARCALAFIPVPSDRSEWLKFGMASHAAGLTLEDFDSWSQTGDNYDAKAVRSAWKSFKVQPGGIGPGTLFRAAQEAGWQGNTTQTKPSAAELAVLHADQVSQSAQAAFETAASYAEAAKRAEAILAKSVPAELHPYLTYKGVAAHGLRVGNWEYVDSATGDVFTITNCLLIPIRDRTKKVHSLQCIEPTPGKLKRYLKGGAKKGHFYSIGTSGMHAGKPVFILVEGYATGASVYESTKHLVLVCFDTSNLIAVALIVRTRAPNAIILIAADNDLWNRRDDGTMYNPGMEAATKAAAAVQGLLTFPPFVEADAWGVDAKGNKTGPKDFNDWHKLKGPETLAAIVAKSLAAEQEKAAQADTITEVGETSCASKLEDFWAHLPSHEFIYVPTRALWPAPSVNGCINEPPTNPATSKPMKPTDWLDRHRAVQQMSWHPGRPMIIEGEVVAKGGWSPYPGARVFNLYQEPTRQVGDAAQAGPWLDHLRLVYPNDWEHIQFWLAHRIQHPGEKINHALVLGGNPGVGKDTLLEPVKAGVGSCNWAEVAPQQITGSQFNPWVQCTVARVSELRDLKEDRFSFYETMKVYIAAPPDSLAVNQKHMREYYVPNVMGVLYTTNNRTDGLYLPADDRRHYVAWSEAQKEDFLDSYWTGLWQWMEKGGTWHVVEYLLTLDLARFNPKASPPKTAAFWAIVHANNAPEDAELSGILGEGSGVDAIVLADVVEKAKAVKLFELAAELENRKLRRAIPHKLARIGYVPVHNPDAKDGLWSVEGHRVSIYASNVLNTSDQVRAARARAALIRGPL
jgi:phage/plasmid primase-like uncharacterized protein